MKPSSIASEEAAAREAERARLSRQRQAEALRLNLKRRKDQSKARSIAPEDASGEMPDDPAADLV